MEGTRNSREIEFVGCVETAKLIRQSLKEAFPGVKFSVRSDQYSMGASVDISWTDGPADEAVNKVVGVFQGSYFDGMIDYKGSIYAELDGKPVHFGADYVHYHRSNSKEACEKAIDRVVEKYNADERPSLEDFRQGRLWDSSPIGNFGPRVNSWEGLIRSEISNTDLYGEAKSSPTANRVRITGDDGYSKQHGSGYDHRPKEEPRLKLVPSDIANRC